MGIVQDLVNAGYGGYVGWNDAAAQADFNATHGAGKQTSSGEGPSHADPPDLAKLTSQTYNLLAPYYQQVAKEAQGDFNRAISILKEDYKTGVRNAKANYALDRSNTLETLKQNLDTLGLQFPKEQATAIDKLNERGMAVYQEGPNQEVNALKITPTRPGVYNPASADINNINVNNPTLDTSGLSSTEALPNGQNMGAGAVELNRIYQEQQLRQQAVQRAANSSLSQSGLQLKQYTNLPSGFDINDPDLYNKLGAAGIDRTQLGSAENQAVRGIEKETRNYQKTAEQLANERSDKATNMANSLATLNVRDIDSDMANQYQKQLKDAFVNQGIT